jgi:membrane fusion protein (multidrug efflux system)
MSSDTKSLPKRVRAQRPGFPSLIVLGSVLLGVGARIGAAEPDRAPPPRELVLPAHVLAYQRAVITAKVAGFVKTIPVDKGDHVKAGQLIAQLEVPELEADRVKYRAQVNVAQRNFARMQKAAKVSPDLVTPQQLDIEGGRLEVARAELARVEVLLGYARVTAPFTGTVTARYVDPGAFVPVPTGGNPRGAAIVTLMTWSRVRIQIPVPESAATWVRPGCPAQITAADMPGQRIAAAITRVSYALSSSSQTMLAEIDMENSGHRLQPGMYVSVRLGGGHSARVATATGKGTVQ